MLYPINENTEVPKNALSSEIWNIPEGVSELIYQCGKEIKEHRESLK